VNTTAIIVAAGKGSRMGHHMGKQYLPLVDKPILVHCLEVFEACAFVDNVILVVGADEIGFCSDLLYPFKFLKVSKIIAGGCDRQHSVYSGLQQLPSDTRIVLIHDGARPFVTVSILEASIDSSQKYGTGIVGMPVKDTIKVVDQNGYVRDTPDRNHLWMIQTPQTFQVDIIQKAHEKAREDGFIGTDDAMLVERMGGPVRMVTGSYENIKVTTQEDLYIGEAIIRSRQMGN